MTKRFVFGLVAGLVAMSLGAFEAQAGQVTLPSALSTLETAGNYAVVNGLTFSTFTYVTTPLGSPPAASDVTVSSFTSVPGEAGISFNGIFGAAAGQTVDYAITYMVAAAPGTMISDAFLSLAGFVNYGGSGSVAVGETITSMSGPRLARWRFTPRAN